MRELVVFFSSILTPLVIYLVLKRTTDKEMVKVFIKAILIVCTLSSIIGIYQFFVDPLFIRVGAEREAFSGLLRTSGVFNAEYTQAYFLIIGTFITLFAVRSRLLKYNLVILFLVGIVLTFHRMSWVVLILLSILYFIEVKKKKVWQMITLGVFAIVFVFLFFPPFVPIIKTGFMESPFVRERLLADTISGRLTLDKTLLKELPKNWLIGVGSVQSDVFYNTLLDAGWSEDYALGKQGLAIHNEFLLIGFFYGIPVLFLFSSFLISCLSYFWKKSKEKSKFFFITTLYIILFIIANLSNMFPLYSHIGLLLAILLGMSVAIYRKNIDVNDLILNEHIKVK
ncbi:MAG: O-antigen ligase family protein [Candidatus Cloacimonadia bacterium]